MIDYYSMEKWHLAELLLLAEDDAATAADITGILNKEDNE